MTRSEMFQIGRRAEQILTGLPLEFVDAVVELGRARLHFVRGEMAESQAAASRVLTFENVDTEQKIGALTIVAMACHDRRRWSEAADCFAELARLRRNGEDWYYLGKCAFELRDVEGAVRALETSRNIDPDALEPCELLARVYRARKLPELEKRVLDDADRLRRRAREVQTVR